MASPAVSDRYVTADFNHAPLIALADLMGLDRYMSEIVNSPEIYSPILSGIAVFRHLPAAERRQVNRAIIEEVPGSHLQSRLRTLVSNQSVQPYWYMWSLSDEELQKFFTFSSTTESATKQFNPITFPELTVATLASGIFLMAKGGPQAAIAKGLESIKRSELVRAVGRRFGLGPAAVQGMARASLPALIVISGVNIMARHQATQAKRELAARGLLAYEDL